MEVSGHSNTEEESYEEIWEEEIGPPPDIFTPTMGATIFLIAVFTLRLYTSSGIQEKDRRVKYLLKLTPLNDLVLLKDVFLTYLYAAMFQPIYAIQGYNVEGAELIMNLSMLGSTIWWIWLITDAFNFEDVTRHFQYYVNIREEAEKDSKRFYWMLFKKRDKNNAFEKQNMPGCLRRDCALWLVLACLLAAWLPGPVEHRFAMHGYATLFFWILTHHACRRATAWTSGYFVTFLFPSMAFMPLEYCLPLVDVTSSVEDLEYAESYREFVIERTGAELIIES
mmetsp:Transcript_27649/g.38891  ORF Transcript_27649/g.38891 Transcript_27649/m.38891 type:complete len:281 (+) Transcript_27649:272-1114(+)